MGIAAISKLVLTELLGDNQRYLLSEGLSDQGEAITSGDVPDKTYVLPNVLAAESTTVQLVGTTVVIKDRAGLNVVTFN
jgi:hypothetical protein